MYKSLPSLLPTPSPQSVQHVFVIKWDSICCAFFSVWHGPGRGLGFLVCPSGPAVGLYVRVFPFHFDWRLGRSCDLAFYHPELYSPSRGDYLVWRESGGSSTCLFLHFSRPAAQRSRAVGEDLGTCLLLDHIFNMGPPFSLGVQVNRSHSQWPSPSQRFG
jgi:hypothetical protein